MVLKHDVRLGKILELGKWHKFKLIRRGAVLKWEYCTTCLNIRNALGIAGADTPWVKKALETLPGVAVDNYVKASAISALEKALELCYKEDLS